MPGSHTIETARALALQALGWTIGEPDRADRLLATTGLTPTDLRARIEQPQMLAAVLGFLLAHEPDLIACADALGERPEALVAAHDLLDAAA
jgi:hypothetical protein